MMKFLADQNIPLEVIFELRKSGFDISSLHEIKKDPDDEAVLSIANYEKRILITFDKDFGEMIFKLKKQNNGVILLRIHPQSVDHVTFVLKKVLATKIDFERSFCVVEINRIRVIPLPL